MSANETIRTLLKDAVAVDRAPWPPCMAPDGAEPCAHYQALTDQLENYREKAIALNRYLRDKNFKAIEAVIVEFSLLAEKKA